MNEKLIGEMDGFKFEQMLNAFIDRPANLDDAIPAELIFAMLDERENGKHDLALESVLINNRLIISAPDNAAFPANVREIEIALPNLRLIIQVYPVAA